jgi:hypothetical protein
MWFCLKTLNQLLGKNAAFIAARMAGPAPGVFRPDISERRRRDSRARNGNSRFCVEMGAKRGVGVA